jgi:dUTPase
MLCLTISSTQISEQTIKHLKINYEKKETVSSIPDLDDDLKWAFIRGYFDGNGCISPRKLGFPTCFISSNSQLMLQELKEFTKLPCSISSNQIEWFGLNALDFLGNIYMGSRIHMKRKYNKFIGIVNWKRKTEMNTFPYSELGKYTHALHPGLNKRLVGLPIFRYVKTLDDAIKPSKTRLSDTGYDLHLIKKIKEVNDVHYFDTGIKVELEYGYYFDLIGRSSISKTGWALANNMGIIDQTYRGSIIVALVKTVPNPIKIELPCKLVQLIPRKVIILNDPEEVVDFTETGRGNTGGLGSYQF